MTPARIHRDLSPDAARREILRAANKGRYQQKPYTMRTIQSAVCRVRRGRLVGPDVLVRAGYQPKERRRG